MSFNVINPAQKVNVKNALQKIYEVSNLLDNLYVVDQVIEIASELDIEIDL